MSGLNQPFSQLESPLLGDDAIVNPPIPAKKECVIVHCPLMRVSEPYRAVSCLASVYSDQEMKTITSGAKTAISRQMVLSRSLWAVEARGMAMLGCTMVQQQTKMVNRQEQRMSKVPRVSG